VVDTAYVYNGSATDSVSLCWVLRSRTDYSATLQNFTNAGSADSREIHICPFWRNVAASQKGAFAELFPFVDEIGNSYGFELYQIQETPVKHLFLLNNGNVTGKMDLYKFVGRLLQLGKIGNAELFSGISLSFTVYSGEGTFHITSIELPPSPLEDCQSCLSSWSGLSCIPYPLIIEGCLCYANPSTCTSCNLIEKWVLSGSTCSCTLGYYQHSTSASTTC
jgi:hypothetical protein